MTNIPAGRELDAKVHSAIAVRWDESRCPVCAWPLAETMAKGCVKGNCSQRPSLFPRSEAPHYSTTWEGMRLVVERMQELAFSFKLSKNIRRSCDPSHITDLWWSYFDEINGVKAGGATEVTAPHAVCLAALRAMTACQTD